MVRAMAYDGQKKSPARMAFCMRLYAGACLAISLIAGSVAAVSLTVTVKSQPMQLFAGLGLNVVQHPSYARYSDVKRQELARKLWKDGHFNCMRLWDFSNPGEFSTTGDDIPLYFDNHIVSDARSVKTENLHGRHALLMHISRYPRARRNAGRQR